MNELTNYLKTSFNKRVLFDTDVVVDFLAGNKMAKAFFEEYVFPAKLTPVLSSQTVCELFMAARNKREEMALDKWLSNIFDLAEIDFNISKEAGLLKRGTEMSSGDSLIAATSKILSLPLITTNPDAYKKVDLRIFKPYL